MSIYKHCTVAAVALAAMLSGAPAFAGGDCCGEGKVEGGGAKTADAKKDGCPLAAREAKQAAAFDGIVGKLTAAQAKLTPEDEKAVNEARKTLVTTCPVGSALTTNLPTFLEAVQAVRCLDGAMHAGKGLPADCTTPEGGCAFCAEAGGKMPEQAKAVMMIGMKALARAEKLGLALAPHVATYQGATTKPAGGACCGGAEGAAQVPTKEQFAKIAEKVDGAVKALAAALEKAQTLPAGEKQKIEAAMAVLDKLAPASSPNTLGPAYMAFFSDLALASDSCKAAFEACTFMHDAKFTEGLSQNAKNALGLFHARSAVVRSLGAAQLAMCPTGAKSACGEAKGDCGKTAEEKKGCCGESSN